MNKHHNRDTLFFAGLVLILAGLVLMYVGMTILSDPTVELAAFMAGFTGLILLIARPARQVPADDAEAIAAAAAEKRAKRRLLVCLSATLLLMLAGSSFGAGTEEVQPLLPRVILCVSAAAAVLLPVAGHIVSSRYSDKINAARQADIDRLMTVYAENAARTTKEKTKLLLNIRLAENIYACFVALLGVLIALTAFACPPPMILPAGFLSVFCLFSASTQLPDFGRKNFEAPKDLLLSREEYPEIHKTVDSAANEAGVGKEVSVLVSTDNNVSVFEANGQIYIMADCTLLNILTEAEMHTILLHEFAHTENVTDKKLMRYLERIEGSRYSCSLTKFPAYFFRAFDVRYEFEHAVFSIVSGNLRETDADRKMKNHPQDAARAFLKLQYSTLFRWEESDGRPRESYYQSETPCGDTLAKNLASFLKALPQRVSFWNGSIANEIQARNASHPTTTNRLAALGISEYPQALDTPSGAYGAECRHALEAADACVLQMNAAGYEINRGKYYLEPLETYEKWVAEGKPLTPENCSDMIDACVLIGKDDEAEAIASRAIETLPPTASHTGLYTRGVNRLHRYDDRGIDDIYAAMDANNNYIDEGIDLIGSYCCLTGNKERLEEYRSRSTEYVQKMRDESLPLETLSYKDALSEEHLPNGMQEENLNYLLSVSNDSLEEVYLTRKTVGDSFFASAFVLKFKPDAGAAAKEEVMHKMFIHLDTVSDWQYALYSTDTLDDRTNARLEQFRIWPPKDETAK